MYLGFTEVPQLCEYLTIFFFVQFYGHVSCSLVINIHATILPIIMINVYFGVHLYE